jgi:hypothetical protein
VGKASLMKRDVGRQRTGSGRIVQFHRNFLPLDYWLWRTGD